MAGMHQIVPDGFGMPVVLVISIVFQIFKWKCDIRNCSF